MIISTRDSAFGVTKGFTYEVFMCCNRCGNRSHIISRSKDVKHNVPETASIRKWRIENRGKFGEKHICPACIRKETENT